LVLKSKKGPHKSTAVDHIKNAIQLHVGDNTISICATNFEEREIWLQALGEICEGYYKKRLFAIPIAEIPNRPYQLTDGIPTMLYNGFKELLDPKVAITEGLFRISAPSLEIEGYREAIDDGNEVDFHGVNPHLICGLIKLYFREQPEPLIPSTLYNDFHTAGGLQQAEAAIASIKNLLKSISDISYSILKRLIEFLVKVASFSEHNKMHARNLAIIIEPNILRKKTILPTDVDALLKQGNSGVVELMINHCSTIFDKK